MGAGLGRKGAPREGEFAMLSRVWAVKSLFLA